MRDTQALSDRVTQVAMTSAKPASLPPTVIETRPVVEFSGPSWFATTSLVRAPEQAVKLNDEGELAADQRYGYAFGERLQSPLETR